MASYYTYLISSLPMLHFGTKPPFPFDKFLKLCKGLVEWEHKKPCSTLKKWRAFDGALRNELVKIRAVRKKLDPLNYMRIHTEKSGTVRSRGQSRFYEKLRKSGTVPRTVPIFPDITHIALHAYRTPSILEAEKILDQARWHLLDDLAIGHYFDIDFLIVYANKLLILERWERINALDKLKALEEVLT